MGDAASEERSPYNIIAERDATIAELHARIAELLTDRDMLIEGLRDLGNVVARLIQSKGGVAP